MSNKLQELTERLYSEGLAKGKDEGEKILSAAKAEAEKIISQAKAEAEAILVKAQKDAEDLKTKTGSDVRMASEQALQATKKDVENLVVAKICDAPVADLLGSVEFLKQIITSVAEKFSAQTASEVSLVLPEKLKGQLEPWVSSELAKAVGTGVQASFSKKMAGGFTIAPKDGSYFISLTDETLKALVGEYLRPVTKKILFG